MSLIYPFAALRPVPEAAAKVASVPYDVVNTDEARALAAGNPLSFLHVSRPEIDLPPDTDPHDDLVYEKATANFAALKQAAPLVVEDRPSFYVYRLRMGAHVQAGIAACFSIDEYDNGLIKKHEKTRPDKEDDRTRHMLAVGAQTGPVFLTYHASSVINALVARVVSGPALFDLTAPDASTVGSGSPRAQSRGDGVRHEVWVVPPAEEAAIVAGFAAVPSLYVADGHHRAASAARARRALDTRGEGEHDRVLAVAFPDNQVQVLPYNRVVRDLNGLAPVEFVAALQRALVVREGGPATPGAKGDVGMYLGGKWYTLTLASGTGRREPFDSAQSKPGDGNREAGVGSRRSALDVVRANPEHVEGSGADLASRLDVSLLQDQVLAPVLGIHDVRTDKRIDFVGGIRGTQELEQLVNSGTFMVAFSLRAVSVDDLMRIADAGGIMPPKSTWFEPKLRDGLLSHVI